MELQHHHPLSDGNHSIRTTATDLAGNASGQSTAYIITVDTVAPDSPANTGLSLVTDSGSSNRDGVTNVNRPSVTGLAEAGSKVAVFIDGVQWAQPPPTAVVSGCSI